MKKILILLLFSITLILSSCAKSTITCIDENTTTRETTTETTTKQTGEFEELNDVVFSGDSKSRNNARGVVRKDSSLITKLEQFASSITLSIFDDYYNDDNLVLSPISIYLAFAMEYETLDNTEKALVLDFLNVTEEDISKTKDVIDSLISTPDMENLKLGINNSIWMNSDYDYEYNTDILNRLSNTHYANVIKAPFGSKNDLANQYLRQYVKERTNDLIDSDFEIPRDILFLLMNILYFKDVWGDSELTTKDMLFKEKSKEFNTTFNYGRYNPGSIIEKEKYKFGRAVTESGFNLSFILPNEEYDIRDIYNRELIEEVNNYKYKEEDAMHIYSQRCIFPSFKIESSFDLVNTISEHYNLGNLFNSYHSRLVDEELCISSIIHKAVYSADKKGTEGAAVTIIGNKATSAGIMKENVYTELLLDRPFAFILSSPEGIVLFAGIVNKL